MRALVVAGLVVVPVLGCDSAEPDEGAAACSRLATEICQRQFYCFVDGSPALENVKTCEAQERMACADAPAEKSDACREAVHNQDCAQLHAHVVPSACIF